MSAPSHLRSFALLLVIAALIASVVGCDASEGDIEIVPPEATPSPSVTTSTRELSPTPGDEGDPRPEFATVIPEWIEGLDTESESNDGRPYNYFAIWPEIEGYPLLGESLSAAISDMRQSFEEQISPPAAGAPWIQELNITFDFLVASGDVIGVRLQRYEFFGAGGTNLASAIWFDTSVGETSEGGPLSPTALLDGERGLAEVAALARAALRARPDLPEEMLLMGTEPVEANYDSIGFTPEGDLLIEFDEYQVGPGSSGSPRVVLPAAEIEPLLSDLGRRARQQVIEPDETLLFPISTPSPTPEVTDPGDAEPTPEGAVDCDVRACVALTFDDGPARETARLLDILAEHDAHATFFVIGTNVPYGEDLLVRMAADGHEISNHTMTHRNLTQLSGPEIREQLEGTASAIEAAGAPRPTLVRPPYGAVDERVAEEVGLPLILWSVDPRDWADRDPDLIAERVADAVRRGSIVLLHDIHETTVDAVPAILADLESRGFVPVTVSELLGPELAAGQSYRSS